MRKKFFVALGVIVATLAAFSAYSLVTGELDIVLPAAAHSTTAPLQPVILYIGQPPQKGFLNAQEMQSSRIQIVSDWRAARRTARAKPIDAILFSDSGLAQMTRNDRDWVRKQLSMGVTIVGIGIEHPQFAQVLGWSHVGTVGEIAPIGKTGYRMVHAFAVGRPEDLARLGNWVELRLSNSDDLPDVSEYPLITTFGQARGTLDSTSAVELLMEQLKSSIEGAYETRAEFQESMKNFKEN